MIRLSIRVVVALSVLILVACDDSDPSDSDAGVDGYVAPDPVDGGIDAASTDAEVDADTQADGAQSPDASDGEVPDASAPDAAEDAASTPDASTSDGGTTEPFVGTFWSTTDKRPEVVVSASGLTLEVESIGVAGVRSTKSMAAGSGVHYFEASIPEHFGSMTVGVVTAAQNLEQRAGESSEGFGIDTGGQAYAGGSYLFGFPAEMTLRYGFVVDYRSAPPIVYVIARDWGGEPYVTAPTTLVGISSPLYVYAAGFRRVQEEQLTLHPGNDLTNDPFEFDPVALLAATDPELAAAIELGVDGSDARTYDEPPVLSVVPTPVTVAVGEQVVLSAVANDAEQGVLTGAIVWEDLATGLGPDATAGTGGSFTFTPDAIGVHPVRITVTDAEGKRARAIVDVTVTGSLASYADVRLVDEGELTGEGITVSPDGWQTHYSLGLKMGIRANQGLYGGFWYFEASRLDVAANIGFGLVIGGVSLDPYEFDVTPPSCSVNAVGGIWRDLMFQSSYDTSASTIGFAVDYRGRHPIAYVIVADEVAGVVELVDATVPIYPMVYGNVTGHLGPYDSAINFGQESFEYDARSALTEFGLPDADELLLCWGESNAACP